MFVAERKALKNAGVAHLVERNLAKVEVASSSLVTRSKKQVIDLLFYFIFKKLLMYSTFYVIIIIKALKEKVAFAFSHREGYSSWKYPRKTFVKNHS